jgi:hypothetical protein
MEALRRKREALAAAQETEPDAQAPPPPLSSDTARAAVAAGGSLAPHAATEVAFTPVRCVQALRSSLGEPTDVASLAAGCARAGVQPLCTGCDARD